MPSLLNARQLWNLARGVLSDFPTADLDESGSILCDNELSITPISDEAGRQRVEYHNQIMNIDRKDALKSLERMSQLCHKHGSKLVLVTLPVFRTYSKHMNMEKFRQDIAGIASIPGVSYINLLNSPLFSLSDFRDNDHLNRAGARKLTAVLKEKCDHMMLAGKN